MKMNRRGFFRLVASAPAAAVVAPAAITEAAGYVTRQAGTFYRGYNGGMRALMGPDTLFQQIPFTDGEVYRQAMSRIHRKSQSIKVLELDFAEIERKMMHYYKDDADFTLKGTPWRKFRAVMDEVYEVEDEPEHIEGLA